MNTCKNILIVDDNMNFCETISEVLEMEGYKTETVYDGRSAIDVIKNDGINLVLMDIKMPVMDGVDTFLKIKDISVDLPVILMTAYAVEDRIQIALSNGAFGVFKKPVDLEKLFNSINRAGSDGALIMIADDDEELSSHLLDEFEEKGYQGMVAEDAETAFHIASENRVDIIILDMKSQAFRGLETYTAIRDIRPDVIVIILSSLNGEDGESADLMKKSSVSACLEKPVDMNQMLEVINKLLDD